MFFASTPKIAHYYRDSDFGSLSTPTEHFRIDAESANATMVIRISVFFAPKSSRFIKKHTHTHTTMVIRISSRPRGRALSSQLACLTNMEPAHARVADLIRVELSSRPSAILHSRAPAKGAPIQTRCCATCDDTPTCKRGIHTRAHHASLNASLFVQRPRPHCHIPATRTQSTKYLCL